MKKRMFLLLISGITILSFAGCQKDSADDTAAETIIDEDAKYYTSLGFDKESSSKSIPAFLGADGYGKYSVGGRKGQVIEVSNLNDSGQGSLRAAVETKGPRTIVFKISGTIYLESMLTITEPYITIAGQTAPGDGICISNYGLTVNTHDVVVRYLRSRPGGAYETDAVWVKDSKNVIIDHMSTSWGTDETLSVSGSDMVSVQYCLISESLNQNNFGTHGMGSLVRGSNGQYVTFHNNLYATHRSRLPMAGNYTDKEEDPEGFNFEFINNVVYNWSGKAAGKNHDVNTVSRFNLINNYYIKGRASQDSYIWSQGCATSQMYAAGNSVNGAVPEDQWSCIGIEDDNTEFSWDTFKLEKPFDNTQMSQIKDAKEAYEFLIKDVGASLSRDVIDTAVIEGVQNNTGKIINKPEQSIGWNGEFPALTSTTPYTDEDKDGMDDSWEVQNGLNPKDSSDGGKVTPCGYTNLEIYLEALLQAE